MYHVKYKYSWWSNVRSIRAIVSVDGWGFLYLCDRTTAKETYKAANRAIRAFNNYNDTNYTGKK